MEVKVRKTTTQKQLKLKEYNKLAQSCQRACQFEGRAKRKAQSSLRNQKNRKPKKAVITPILTPETFLVRVTWHQEICSKIYIMCVTRYNIQTPPPLPPPESGVIKPHEEMNFDLSCLERRRVLQFSSSSSSGAIDILLLCLRRHRCKHSLF